MALPRLAFEPHSTNPLPFLTLVPRVAFHVADDGDSAIRDTTAAGH